MANDEFTHFDETGRPQMVDISDKHDTKREAYAQASVLMSLETRTRIEQRAIRKGDVLSIAELAGIMGAKKTADIIPLCHPLPLSKVNVECNWVDNTPDKARLVITSCVQLTYKTGAEMEALTACTAAALTVYDMCKKIDRGMIIEEVKLLYKSGGDSGTFGERPALSNAESN